jgi:hypothetical protein
MIPQVLVNWTYELSDQTGFLLQRCNNLSGVWNVDIATGGDTFEYTDSDVAVGDTRSYQVAATNEYGTGSFSNTGSVYITSNGPTILFLTAKASSDIKPFDGTVSSSAIPTVTPDITVFGDSYNLTQSFDYTLVGFRNLAINDGGSITSGSGNTYVITINTNTGSITGPSTSSIDTGGYIVVPPNTDIPYEIGQSLTIVDVASGSNGFLTTFYYHDAGQQVAFTSSNGNNWTTASIIPAELIVGGVAWAYGNGRYLTIGTVAPTYDYSDQRVQYTDNGGATWNTASFSAVGRPVWDFIYDGTKFVGCCEGGIFVTSSNGINWGTTTTGTGEDLWRLLYNSGHYFAIGQPLRANTGGTGKIYTSTNLITWQAVSSSVPTTNAYLGITYSPSLGIYLAVGEQGLMATSSNGVNWGDCSQPSPIYDTSLLEVSWNSVNHYFAANDFNGYIYNSPDGINWTLNTINPRILYNGQYYYYSTRLKYYSSINKFLIFNETPST